MSKSETVKVFVIKGKITPYGFYSYARDYLTAFLNNQEKKRYSPVPYFLCCRSLELFFKAYLLAKGVSLNTLKKVRHDLLVALRNAKERDLESLVDISPEAEEELRKANEYYKEKEFEYYERIMFKAGLRYPDLPKLHTLKELAENLKDKLKHICISA